MLRALLPFVVAAATVLLPAQDAEAPKPPAATLGLDDHIAWRSDGQDFHDHREAKPSDVDRAALVDAACAEAKQRGTLVLWYVHRIHEQGLRGRQMYRAPVLDVYMRQVVFGDPDVAELCNHAFVPLRCAMDQKLCDRFDLRPLQFVEPAVVWLDGDGKVVHYTERFRTFHGPWFANLCVRVLEHAGVKLPGATVDELRRVGRWRDALALALQAKERSREDWGRIAKLHTLLRQPEQARAAAEEAKEVKNEVALGGPRSTPEGDYARALEALQTGDEALAMRRFRATAEAYPDTIWGRRARANVTPGLDDRPLGAAFAGFESTATLPEAAWVGLPKDTTWQGDRMTPDAIAAAGVEFLLQQQRKDGGFTDSRYAYWPNSEITPNVWVAITAIACTALLEYRPPRSNLLQRRIDLALRRGEAFLLDPSRLNRGKNEDCYADAYRLMFFARRAAANPAQRPQLVARMNEIVAAAVERQRPSGFWAHEYENAFATGAVLQQVLAAKAAGADVPAEAIDRAASALLTARFDNGAFAYGGAARNRPTGVKDSAGRMPVCEGTLLQVGRSDPVRVRAALDAFWGHMQNLETVRRNDFHSDGELAGFFFFHSLFHASEVVRLLPEDERKPHWQRFVEVLQRIPEFDGSFVDSHELGRSYGTAMALLVLKNARSDG
ncbi:MAG: hypothetical protein JNL08_15050 [Planctomycetes bacterium]|nr:hypothetical protein [Planctomycetota bacterium]